MAPATAAMKAGQKAMTPVVIRVPVPTSRITPGMKTPITAVDSVRATRNTVT